MTVQNFIKRFFYIFLVLFLLQIIFFILLQDLFKYTIFEQESFFFYFYSINYFIALFTVYLIIRYYKNENKFNLTFGGLNFDEISFKILGLVYLGILLSILSKSFLYFQPYFSGEITENPNVYLTGSSNFNPSCTLMTIRSLWKVNTDLISNNQLQLFLYNVLSPLGTILLNLQAILFLIIYLLSNKISKKTYILILFTLILNLLVYAVIVSSKNIVFNFFTLNLCFFIIALAVKKINLSKILTFIIFSFISIALVIFFQILRSNCSTIDQPNYNSEIEFENKYNVPENLGDDPEGKNELQEQNIQRSGRYFLIERESKVLNKFGLKQIENVTINYSLYYLLTGKINGEYIFENIKRPRIGNIILSKTLNIFSKDINKKIIDVQVYWPKAWGGISFLHLLWYDYYYFGIALFILFFIFLIIVIFKLKLNKTEFIEIINLLVIYLMAIFIYIFIQFFNWYSLETINSRFLFFNLLVFILYIYIKVKKNLNE